jgi:hypothetical protein
MPHTLVKISPGDESACHPNPESLRQVEILLMPAQRFGELQGWIEG